MYVTSIYAGQVALALTLAAKAHHEPGDSIPPVTRPQSRTRTARLRGVFQFLPRLRSAPRASHRRVAKPIDMSSVECVGRPYLIGAGTFLVATYLQSRQHASEQPDVTARPRGSEL